MKEDYMIKIAGIQQQDGEENKISLTTKGSFVRRGNSFFITYNETETTGFKDCVTTVKVTGPNKISMLRYGPAPSQLVVERGQRHVCHYETGYGAVSLGVSADEISTNLTETGGEVHFSYLLDMNTSSISRNIVNITVKPI